MRKTVLLALASLLFMNLAAQELSVIKLNAPNKERGLSIMQALDKRASAKEFNSKELSLQDLSDLVWAANGINRPSEGKRTAPSAVNAQDVDVYVCLPKGFYLYDAKEHQLKPIAAGDHRKAVAGKQPNFATAPLFLVLVSDISRFKMQDEAGNLSLAAMDAGIVSQNIALFCSGTGLQTRPRAYMDKDQLKTILKLTDKQHLMLNMPVGY